MPLSTHIQLFVYATTLCILDEQNMITVKMNFLVHELDFDIFTLLMMVALLLDLIKVKNVWHVML
jgi:hypothetical protein